MTEMGTIISAPRFFRGPRIFFYFYSRYILQVFSLESNGDKNSDVALFPATKQTFFFLICNKLYLEIIFPIIHYLNENKFKFERNYIYQ